MPDSVTYESTLTLRLRVHVLRLLLQLLDQGDNLCHRSVRTLSPLRSDTSAMGVPPVRIISDQDWRFENVPEAGRPSRKREDHHLRAVATGDEGAEGNQLPPGQRIGKAKLPHR